MEERWRVGKKLTRKETWLKKLTREESQVSKQGSIRAIKEDMGDLQNRREVWKAVKWHIEDMTDIGKELKKNLNRV